MGKTYKDNREYKEVIDKTKNRKLSVEEKRKLQQLKNDLYLDRVAKNGFA